LITGTSAARYNGAKANNTSTYRQLRDQLYYDSNSQRIPITFQNIDNAHEDSVASK
jgi:hypothetical protein